MRIIIVMTICSLLIAGCAQPTPEKRFGVILKELDRVAGLSLFGPNPDDCPDDCGLSKTAIRILTNLKDFINEYPQSEYVDDAEYLLIKLTMGESEKYVSRLRDFAVEYPGARLENKTLNSRMFVFEKRIPLDKAIQFEIATTLRHIGKYKESNDLTRKFIDNLDVKKMPPKGRRIISLAYFYMLGNFESLGDKNGSIKICQEASAVVNSSYLKEACSKIEADPESLNNGI